ncbi:MAG: TolC family protein [Candidatus Sericytochromatia bacterium]
MRRAWPGFGMVVGLLVAVGGPDAAAQAALPSMAPSALTLDEVLTPLAESYPPLDAARRDLALAEAEAVAAAGGFDPAWRSRAAGVPVGGYPQFRLDTMVEQPLPWMGLTVFGGYRLGTGSFAVYDGKLETNAGGELRAGVAMPLLRNGPIDRRRANWLRAEGGLLAAQAALRQQQLEAFRLAAHRYWDWVGAGRKLAVGRAVLAIATQRDAALAASVQSGQAPPIERVENERAILQREAQVLAAERALTQAAIELSLLHRDLRGGPVVPPPGRLPPDFPAAPDVEGLALDRALSQAQRLRPEPARLAAQRAQAQVELEWAENQLSPGLDFSVTGAQDLGSGSAIRAVPELEAAIGLDVPLLTRGPVGRIGVARAAVARLASLERFARDRVAADVRDAHNAVAMASRRWLVADRELALSRRLEAAERDRFTLGEGTLFLVNLREQATADAASRLVDAQVDLHKSWATYQAAVGLPAPAAPGADGSPRIDSSQ